MSQSNQVNLTKDWENTKPAAKESFFPRKLTHDNLASNANVSPIPSHPLRPSPNQLQAKMSVPFPMMAF